MTKEELIKEYCLKQTSINPIEIAIRIMNHELISIHGPEHHIIDGAALLTAMHNAGEEFDLSKALDEMVERGNKMPGATCGKWGVCGSSASLGAALSIIHETGPLSDNEYYKDNLHLTSLILGRIGDVGGPRCCKRNAFIALTSAVEFVNEKYNLKLEMTKPVCSYSLKNKQCIGSRCPFHK